MMRRASTFALASCGFVLLALGVAWAQTPPVDPWQAALEYFEDYGQWDALRARAMAFDRLATLGDPRAIDILHDRYLQPRDPHRTQERYLIAGSLEHFVRAEQGAAEIDEWAEQVRRHVSAPWLEYNAMRVHCSQLGPDELIEVTGGRRETVFRRAAAIEALGMEAEPAVVAGVIAELLAGRVSRNELEAHILVGACASAVVSLGRRDAREAAAPATSALVELLDDRRTPEGTKVLIARHLAAFTGAAYRGTEADIWRGLLGQQAGRTGRGGTSVRFMGLETQGRRIAYLIDMSDSMLLPLSDSERDALQRPETGSNQGRTRPAGAGDDLPWDRIHTRFDAVREFLKLSLRTLEPGMAFVIIGFGSRAELFRVTPGMTVATPESVRSALEELDAITPGPVTETRSYGTLRGMTNVHAAMRLAFSVTVDGRITSEDEHVNPDTFVTGCDTIFLLSDGSPTMDDYAGSGPERDYPGYPERTVTVRDPETGEEREVTIPAQPPYRSRQGMVGPFYTLDWFTRDLRRMNLFRKVELNAVGVGEYNRQWLEGITGLGLGQLRLIGNGEAPPASGEDRE